MPAVSTYESRRDALSIAAKLHGASGVTNDVIVLTTANHYEAFLREGTVPTRGSRDGVQAGPQT